MPSVHSFHRRYYSYGTHQLSISVELHFDLRLGITTRTGLQSTASPILTDPPHAGWERGRMHIPVALVVRTPEK